MKPKKEEKISKMTVISSAFKEGEVIPSEYTCAGKNISPELSWSGIPPQAKSLVLICDDPDAPKETPWVHWVVYDLPAHIKNLSKGVSRAQLKADGAHEGMTDFDKPGYGGPCPPEGHGVHHYHFNLYAIDKKKIDIDEVDATKEKVLQAIEGHIVAQGHLIGTFERK